MLVFLKMSGTILSILSRRFCFLLVNLEQWRKKWIHVLISSTQTQIWLSASKKLCLNLCYLKWIRPTRRRMRKISPFGWLTLKTLLLWDLIKFKTILLKVQYEGELRISESNLFHSTNADGKRIKKKVTTMLYEVIFILVIN